MAITQAGSLSLTVASTLTDSGDISSPSDALSQTYTVTLTNGSGADQANQRYRARITLSTDHSLDLYGGLTDVYGNTLNITRLKGFSIKGSTANINRVRVVSPSSDGVPFFLTSSSGISGGLDVYPGGFWAWGTGSTNAVAVTSSSGDRINLLHIGSSSQSVTCDVIIIGIV